MSELATSTLTDASEKENARSMPMAISLAECQRMYCMYCNVGSDLSIEYTHMNARRLDSIWLLENCALFGGS